MVIPYHDFYLISLILLRLIGTVVFIDFYLRQRYLRFLFLILASLLLTISPLVDIILPQDSLMYKPVLILSEVVVLIAIFFYVSIFFNYIKQYSKKNHLIILTIITILPVISYLLVDFEPTFILIQIEAGIIISSIFPFAIINRKKLIVMSSNSLYFFIISGLLVLTNLFLSIINFIIDVKFAMDLTTIMITFFVFLVFIHLEYNLIAVHKFIMKDNYSHNMTQYLQLLVGRLHLASHTNDQEKVIELIDQMMEDCDEMKNLIYQIRRIG